MAAVTDSASDPVVLEAMIALSALLREGEQFARALSAQLTIEQTALMSRSVELVETVLGDKQTLLDRLDTIEKRMDEIFSSINVFAMRAGQTARHYIRERFPLVEVDLNHFVGAIGSCRSKGMENDGLLNLQLVQISSTIAMLSPQNASSYPPTYTLDKSKHEHSVSFGSWIA